MQESMHSDLDSDGTPSNAQLETFRQVLLKDVEVELSASLFVDKIVRQTTMRVELQHR